MVAINENMPGLRENYLFAEVAARVKKYREANPGSSTVSLGIGDVTRPLCPAVVRAAHEAVDELSSADTFRGYGPEQGYSFLREAIAANDYAARGVDISPDEIFISDGAKSDLGNFQELLSRDCRVAVTDPVYPVYVDSNVMAGRKVEYLPCTAENGFMPEIPEDGKADVIYLCFPNNPTGAVMDADTLALWVAYALRNGALIMYDSAYHAYISDGNVPHSIYEIEGAKKCAVEFRSYSKTAGFTSLRCGYTVVPKDLKTGKLNRLWFRRQCTKFNGASYVSQKAAGAIYSPEGKKETAEVIEYYMTNASMMLSSLRSLGMEAFGGTDAPYIWVKVPDGLSSWEYFDLLLNEAGVICTPGAGFGPHGEGFIRLTAFGSHEDCEEALRRIGTI